MTATMYGLAAALNPTSVKTSAYSAAAGDFVPVSTASGAVTVTLPNAPANTMMVGVEMVAQSGSNAVTVSTSGSDVFNVAGGPTSFVIAGINQPLLLVYSSGIWYMVAASASSASSVVTPSGDTTGATDSAAISAALTGFPRKHAVLAPGTFYINAPIASQNQAWLQGSGRDLTYIKQGSAFVGTAMWTAADTSAVSDLTFQGQTTTTSSNPAADAIYITQNGNFVHGVAVTNVGFQNINGWCVHVLDDATHGAMTGMVFRYLWDQGSNSGGMGIFGAQRTMGPKIIDCQLNANGGTSTTLDALYIQDVFDLELEGAYFGVGGTSTGYAMHLIGHNSNMRFIRGEIGSGFNDLLIEDNVNGHASIVQFIGIVFQTSTTAEDVVISGTATDISFTNCEFSTAKTHGVTVSTTGNRISFNQCRWGVPGSSNSNGAGASGTNYDLNWSGSGTGTVTNCEFASAIVSTGVAGVQKSVNVAAGQHVAFMGVRFSGTSASSANWFTSLPSAVLETGTNFNFANVAAPQNYLPSNPTSTTAGTGAANAVMMGLGSTCTYTPGSSGKVLFSIALLYLNLTATQNVIIIPKFGTGTAPANGAAVTGTSIGPANGFAPHSVNTANGNPFALTSVLSLTPGTTYWFDVALATTNTADAAEITNVSMALSELS